MAIIPTSFTGYNEDIELEHISEEELDKLMDDLSMTYFAAYLADRLNEIPTPRRLCMSEEAKTESLGRLKGMFINWIVDELRMHDKRLAPLPGMGRTLEEFLSKK